MPNRTLQQRTELSRRPAGCRIANWEDEAIDAYGAAVRGEPTASPLDRSVTAAFERHGGAPPADVAEALEREADGME